MKRQYESTIITSSNNKLIKNQNPEAVFQDKSSVTINKNKLLIYWFDAYEDKALASVYLFGKTFQDLEELSSTRKLEYVSVCLVIKNLPRKIYVKPNISASIESVKTEINSILLKHKINEYSLVLEKKSSLFHKFHNKTDKDVIAKDKQNEEEYLKVEYNTHHNEPIIKTGNTFSNVLYPKISYLEQLILDLKLKGPGWLCVYNSLQNSLPISWCKYEFIVDDYRNISLYNETAEKMPSFEMIPPLTLITLSINTRFENSEHEIYSISGVILKKFYFNGNFQEVESSFCAIQEFVLDIHDLNIDNPIRYRMN